MSEGASGRRVALVAGATRGAGWEIAVEPARVDGSRPDCWGHLAAYGWEHDDGRGIDQFR